MPDRTLVRVRCDDVRVADRVERFLQREEPAGLDAVVVGDQNSRPARPLVERLRRAPQRAWTGGGAGDRQRFAALEVHVATLEPGALARPIAVGSGAV